MIICGHISIFKVLVMRHISFGSPCWCSFLKVMPVHQSWVLPLNWLTVNSRAESYIIPGALSLSLSLLFMPTTDELGTDACNHSSIFKGLVMRELSFGFPRWCCFLKVMPIHLSWFLPLHWLTVCSNESYITPGALSLSLSLSLLLLFTTSECFPEEGSLRLL